jgi:hypothetical protein
MVKFSVYFAVRTEFLNVIQMSFSFKELICFKICAIYSMRFKLQEVYFRPSKLTLWAKWNTRHIK